MSFPPEMTSPLEAGQRKRERAPRDAPRLVLCLTAASGLRRSSLLRGHCFCRCSFVQFLDNAPRPRRIDVDPGAHRARQGNSLDVAPFRPRGLRAHDLVEQRGVVLEQLALLEALLADRDVDVRAAVGAVLELARLRLANRLPDVHRDGARLGVRHLAARAEDAPELADDAHLVGRRDGDVEVVEALLDLRREIRRADDVRAGLLGLARLLAVGEDGDARLAAGAVREHQRPAQLLLGVVDVQPEVEVRLDRLVELRRLAALQQTNGFDRRVQVLAIDLRAQVAVILAVFHRSVSTPIERAVPAMISIACSTSRAFRSVIFASAIDCSWSRRKRPTLSRFGSPEPFSSRSASLIRTAAGGVLVMKSNERSS